MNQSTFSTINPSTGEQIETFSFFTPEQTEAKLACADKAYRSFRKMPVHQRADLLIRLAQVLRNNKKQLSKVITAEMGKILREAEAEVEKAAIEAEWYAEHGPRMFADEHASTGGIEAYVLPASWTDHRSDAVEPAYLAGHEDGSSNLACGERGSGEALAEHAEMFA